MKPDPRKRTRLPVDDVLSAIEDGRSVDWDQAMESSGGGSERRTLEVLRVLARVQDLTPSETLEVPVRWGSLEIQERLGSGGFASVYRALDPVLGLEVALKVLHQTDAKASEEILAEGRLLARVRHPNVVRIFGVEELGGRIGLRMELIRGRSLDRVVREDGPLGPIEAIRTGLDVCRALAAVHQAGLVHRDVKAQNVMREADGRVVLMDLGASEESSGSTATAARSSAGAGVARGTPLYLAPEILGGQAATPSTDVYATGVLLFFLVSCRFPIEASSLDLVREAHVSGRTTPLNTLVPELPRRLLDVVACATHADPESRFASVRDMARALAEALSARDDWSSVDVGTTTLPQLRGNLPPSFTRFVGRRDSLEAAGSLLRRHRLVTLVGPGGCGKTRLALELGASLQETFKDGAWFVSLAPVRDDHGVARVFAEVFGTREVTNEPLVEGIARALESRHALVVVDNCEHVSEAVSTLVAELRARTTSVVFALTSRVPVGIAGEVIYNVTPLEVAGLEVSAKGIGPLAGDIDDQVLARISQNDAVQLFVDRARAVRPDFDLTAVNVEAVARICRELDGLPLALELAAAQLCSVPVGELAARLRDRLDLLRATGTAEPVHHQTLLSSIGWSYDLLTEKARAVLRSLSLFTGGWTLEAAEAVIPEATGIRERDVLPLLSSLVTGSLVRLGGTEAAEHRYDMLATVREYARHRLDEDGGYVATARAFVGYFVELAKRMNLALMGAGDVEAMRTLNLEHDNIRAACRATLELGDLAVGLDLLRHLGRFWMTSGFSSEGRGFCEAFLTHPATPGRTLDRAAVAGWLAVFVKLHGETELARQWWEESLDIRRERNDRHGVASALNGLGTLEYDAGRFSSARRLYEQSLAIRRELEEARGIAQSLTNLGLSHAAESEMGRALECLEEARRIHEDLGNAFGVAKTLGEIGFLRSRQGCHDQALRTLTNAVEIQAQVGPNVALPCRLGFAHYWAGSMVEARDAFRSALGMFEDRSGSSPPDQALFGLALIADHFGQPEQAGRLLGAVAGNPARVPHPWERDERSALEARLRANLGDDAFDRVFSEGLADPESAIQPLKR